MSALGFNALQYVTQTIQVLIVSLFTVDLCPAPSILKFEWSLYYVLCLSYKYSGTEWISIGMNALYNS